MKRILMALITVGLLLIVSCAPIQPIETPIPPTPTPTPSNQQSSVILPDAPPEDVTWISPGKVMVGNFYPGARAEWDLVIHNGRQEFTPEGQPTGIFLETQFAVTYRYPDHVGEGYSRPAREVQDWVIIADTTPVLAPKETKEILVALDIPEDADRWSVPVWNLSELGINTRDELRVAYQEAVEKAIEEGIEGLPEKPELLLFLEGIYGVIVGSVDVNDEYMNYITPTREDSWEFWISVMDTTQTGMVQTELASRWLVVMR